MNIKRWNGKVKKYYRGNNKNGGVVMNGRLLELQKELHNNLYKATMIAEKNTKRNEMGQVVIPVDDEWRDEDCWDDLHKYGKETN